MTSPTPLLVGMFGGGTVGGGVYQLLQKLANTSSKSNLSRRRPIVIKTICVRSLDKPRDFDIDTTQTTLTTDPQAILQDASIDCVVEVMGGTGLAQTVVLEALRAKKAVVTANKALLAEYLTECATAAIDNDSVLAYEAAVCGGIPIIQLLQAAYAGDTIQAIQGICNGTTNYMLCKMEQGADYDAVLKEAQDLGYAEADPTADVEGHDVRAKIALLAKLAFGPTIHKVVEDIPCLGISAITSVDFAYGKLHNTTIKLIGCAQLLPQDPNTLSVYVSPVMVPRSHALASATGSGNLVTVTSHNMGATPCSYSGPGAGRFPTANSIVADVMRVANGTAVHPPFPRHVTHLTLQPDYRADHWYLRFAPSAHLSQVVAAAQFANVNIASLETVQGHLCVVTDACQRSQLQALTDHVLANSSRGTDESSNQALFMPFLKE